MRGMGTNHSRGRKIWTPIQLLPLGRLKRMERSGCRVGEEFWMTDYSVMTEILFAREAQLPSGQDFIDEAILVDNG